LVLNWSGPLPTKFSWQDKSWSPEEFAEQFGIQQARQFHYLSPREPNWAEQPLREQMRQALQPFGGKFSLRVRDWSEIEAQMRKALDLGVPVLVGLKWGRDGHVLTAIGYEIRKGQVFAWKFLNSWGRWTKDGTIYYKASDLRAKADEVWLIQK
jgi:hypothetical protein